MTMLARLCEIFLDLATELEGQRNEIERLRELVDEREPAPLARMEAGALIAEVERLREQNKELHLTLKGYDEAVRLRDKFRRERSDAEAEIERLRGDLAVQAKFSANAKESLECQRQEIERLRVVEKIVKPKWSDDHQQWICGVCQLRSDDNSHTVWCPYYATPDAE